MQHAPRLARDECRERAAAGARIVTLDGRRVGGGGGGGEAGGGGGGGAARFAAVGGRGGGGGGGGGEEKKTRGGGPAISGKKTRPVERRDHDPRFARDNRPAERAQGVSGRHQRRPGS